MKYLGTRSQQYDPVVTQDINNKENAISSTGLKTSIKDTDYLVMYEKQSKKTFRILWSNIKSKIETFIRAAFKTTPLSLDSGGTGATTAEGARAAIGAGTSNFVVAGNAGAHNAIYRGKNLGTSVTAAQWAAIAAGTFEDMYIGDYWVIGGVTYRIAAFDYYYSTGDTFCGTHHVTLVPDGNMYTHVMNDTNVTTGAYVGSKMYTTGLSAAKTTINNAFGSAHILNHRQYLKNAVTNGYESAGSWYDSTVELMTEQNVYGGKVFANCTQGTNLAVQYTVDKSQYPLFAHRPDMISNRAWFWLRDVASVANFCNVNDRGNANGSRPSSAIGVRPAFSIKS